MAHLGEVFKAITKINICDDYVLELSIGRSQELHEVRNH